MRDERPSADQVSAWGGQFQKAFDPAKVKKQQIVLDPLRTLVIGERGIHLLQTVGYKPEPEVMQRQAFEHLFFCGPKISDIPFEVRKALRDALWEAVDADAVAFTKRQVFQLFDYEKIAEKRWERRRGEGGDVLAIHRAGRVEISGWDNARDGGGHWISIEAAWHEPELHVPFNLKHLIPALLETLGAGRVES